MRTVTATPTRQARMRHTALSLKALLATSSFLVFPIALLAMIPAPALATSSAEESIANDGRLQEPVALIADNVVVDREANTLTATGNVEMFQAERTLTAEKIVYNRETDKIDLTGPIVIRDTKGSANEIIVADFGSLDADLQAGILQGARMAISSSDKFAAVEAERIDGRYTVLGKAVYSPCQVCASDPVPLWQIRADRVVHDDVEQVIHYENAVLDVAGVPVFYTPYFRHPEPGVDRSSGFLEPEYKRSSIYGLAFELPYYYVVDDQNDVTFSPFIMTDENPILQGEWRRAFDNGGFRLGGSGTVQSYTGDDDFHGHIDSAGIWVLDDKQTEVGFDFLMGTDDAYVRRYGFDSSDRLNNEIFARRSDNNGFGEISLVRTQSLRDDENYGSVPMALPTFEHKYKYDEDVAGGTIGTELAGYGLLRSGGTDTAHMSGALNWNRSEVFNGLVVTGTAETRADYWQYDDDFDLDSENGDGNEFRLAPLAALEARFPFVAFEDRETGTATHIFEPIAQFVVAPMIHDGDDPNEDSTLTEFDETNLFALRRHSGYDGFEEGTRLNYGIRYQRTGTTGNVLSASFGQVLRFEEINSFEDDTGLNDVTSDFVGAWNWQIANRINLYNRLRFDDDFSIKRNEVYVDTRYQRFNLGASYLYLDEDENAESASGGKREEIKLLGGVALSPNWRFDGELRRNLETDDWVRTEGEITYANECVNLAFYLGKKYTSSRDVPSETYFGLRLKMFAFGGTRRENQIESSCEIQT